MTALARPVSEAVTVEPADECIDAPAVARKIETWLRRDTLDDSISVEISPQPDRIAYRVTQDGEVRVEHAIDPVPAECADRTSAVGLAAAMAIDAAVIDPLVPEPPRPPEPAPPAREDPLPPEPVPAPPPEPPPEPTVDASSSPPPEPASPLRFRAALASTIVGAFGVLPRAALGGELSVELGLVDWLDLRLAGFGLGALSESLGGGRVTTSLGAGAAAICPARAFGRRKTVRLIGCVGVAAGAVLARGRDFDQTRRPILPWVALRTGLDLDIRLVPRLSLRASGAVSSPFVSLSLDVRDAQDEVVVGSSLPRVGGLAGLGLVVHLTAPADR